MAGRARGRARAQQKPGSAPAPAPGQPAANQSSSAASFGPAPVSAWAKPAGPPPSTTRQNQGSDEQSSRAQSGRPRGGPVGDVAKKMGGLSVSGSVFLSGNGDAASDNGNGGNGKPVGRGGMRGRREIERVDAPRTKPDHVSNKQGSKGQKVKLKANYFALETRADWVIYQYRVDFNVEEDRTFVRKAWIREHRERLGNNYLFDGTVLFTSNRLTANNEPLELICTRQSDNLPVQIKLRLVGELRKGHYMYLQIFNILVRRCLDALKLQLVGRNYFDAAAKVCINTHKIELWPGYVTSIRQHEQQILMMAEISHKVMRMDTVHDLLNECTRSGGDYKAAFQTAILGQIVLTDYNNKTYRVDDVVWDQTASSTFEGKNNEKISYLQYYQTRYQLRIRDPKQPLLVSRPTARDIRGGRTGHIMLIPELCRLTGLTDQMRSNYQLMSAMAEYTRVNPEARMDKLLKFNARLHNEKLIRDEFKAWNMTLSKNLIDIDGRRLPEEVLIAGKEAKYGAGAEADWTRELRSRAMFINAEFRSFVVVTPTQLRRDTESFLASLKKSADGMEFRIPKPDIINVDSDRIADLHGAVERVAANGIPSLMMFIVTNNRGDRYAAIKNKCCVERAIPSQVVLKKNLMSKGVMSICTKIAIQLNVKLGGTPWLTAAPTPKTMMIVGYDVCHDTMNKGRSVGAFVASLSQNMGRWYSTVDFHTNGEELSNHMAANITFALRKYQEVNKALPERIMVYRDGVGEGQIHYVFNHEVKQFRDALTKVYGGETWKLGYVIVTKKLNTRIFDRTGPNGNPRPGTVVDDTITNPDHYDFFLVSQSVRQGTVSPTNYNIIWDNLGVGIDPIQSLSYKLTHLYYNWSGTVRVPAPCQYAHKLAFLVGQSLHRLPNPALSTTLYFL